MQRHLTAGHLSGKERDNIKREPWKYKIGGKAQGLFPSLLLLILFGVPGILLYRKENGAFLFFLILAACMTAVLFAVIYRAAFVKVLIYRNGFFHQKSPRKGRFYPYSQIRQAWISSDRPVGGPACWCSYQTTAGQIFRFPFFLNESDGVDYLIEHVTRNSGTNTDTSGRREEYSIDGKSEGIAGIAAAAVILILFLLFGIPVLQQTAAAGRWAAAVCIAVGISVPLSVLLRLTVRYCCFRVLIQSTGFYVQTTPFNGKFYSYGEIESCREEKKT
ncbi:MAG: hypothetical protein PUC59_08920, partial [Firmicutes bacterium]|nr:hypothetical protein [Bacillota bacterium]